MSTVTAVSLSAAKRGYLVYLQVGIVLACIAAFALGQQDDDFLTRNARAGGVVTMSTGMQYLVVALGAPAGSRLTDADAALVNFKGKLLDGKTFDKSQQPAPMPRAASCLASPRL